MSDSRSDESLQQLAKQFGQQPKKNNFSGIVMQKLFTEKKSTAEIFAAIRNHVKDNKIIVNGIQLTTDHVKLLSGGGSNNLNLLVQTDDAALVLQVGTKRQATNQAIEQLRKSTNPLWLAKKYGEVVCKLDEDKQQRTAMKMIASMQILEKCQSSLESEVSAVHALEAQHGGMTPVTLMQLIGVQLSSMLTMLSQHHIIWFDMKPENILLRNHNQIVIPDIKAFLPTDALQLIYDNQRDCHLVDYGNMLTDKYLSDNFTKHQMTAPATRLSTQHIWEQEYSHQIAVILYFIATNTDLRVVTEPGKDGAKFDFDKPVFKDPAGQRLRFIIESLSADNPHERLHHTDAKELLLAVGNKDKFETIVKSIPEKRQADSQPRPSKPQKTPGVDFFQDRKVEATINNPATRDHKKKNP